MALTRKLLKSMGIEDEKIDQIIEAHTETTDALKQGRDDYKKKAEQFDDVKAELDQLKDKPDDGYKEKYENEHKEFEEFKNKTAQESAEREKKSLYRKLLIEAGIDSKRVDSVLRVADLSDVEVKDGAIVDSDKLSESVKKEWSDFIPQQSRKTEPPANPPDGGSGESEPKSLAEALRQKYDHKD